MTNYMKNMVGSKLFALLGLSFATSSSAASVSAKDAEAIHEMAELLKYADGIDLIQDVQVISGCTAPGSIFKTCTIDASRTIYPVSGSVGLRIPRYFWNALSTVDVAFSSNNMLFDYSINVNGRSCLLAAPDGTGTHLPATCILPVNGGPELKIDLTIPQGGTFTLEKDVSATIDRLTLRVDRSTIIDKMTDLANRAGSDIAVEISSYRKISSDIEMRSRTADQLAIIWKIVTSDRNWKPEDHLSQDGLTFGCPSFEGPSHRPSHTAAECMTVTSIWAIYQRVPTDFTLQDEARALGDLKTRADILTTVIKSFEARAEQLPDTWAAYVASLVAAKVIEP